MRIGAEDAKAKLGTGGIPSWLTKSDYPAKEGDVRYHQWLRKLGGTGFGGKSVVVTQGDLIVSSERGNLFFKTVRVKGRATNGEKSDVGIVAKKLARKAAKASESA